MTVATTDTMTTRREGISDERAAGLVALTIIGLFAGSTALWGLVGLAMAALSMVPVIYVVLLLITVGK
ncbi:hypothetical protein [Thetidibacter halocola]|uniref:Uncharacterized protein n=1 Tax=Thetidibacter halocola TaxID=2827239 RepID=A0A8J8B7L1_9RHOB|nr:hypothetical protein [Thetidibacter halocola]MBS0124532.1 hypothetical protein [Thetidibacter halocola]